MTANLYELSDCLFQFRRWFLQEMAAGTMFTPEQVEQIGDLLFVSGQVALRHAHEISRHRWNATAPDDSTIAMAVDEAMRPDSNVVLLTNFVTASAPRAST